MDVVFPIALLLILAVLIGLIEDHAEPLDNPSEWDAALTAAPLPSWY